MKKSKLQQLAEIEHAKGGFSAHVIDFDQESAEWALSTSEGNRDEGEADIDAQADAMDNDKHIFDGNTLSFERKADGQHLFDGHHRCKARIRAKTTKPIMVAVTFNSPPGSQRIRVSGRRWTPADWARRLGFTRAHASVVTAIHCAVGGSPIGPTRDMEIIAAMELGGDSINAVVEQMKKHDRLCIAPVAAGIAMAWLKYPKASAEFLAYYLDGGRPKGCPAFAMREHVHLHGRVASQQSDERVKLTWSTISAIVAFANGKELTIIRPSAPSVEPVLDAWSSLRGGNRADVAEWMKAHQKKRHRASASRP